MPNVNDDARTIIRGTTSVESVTANLCGERIGIPSAGINGLHVVVRVEKDSGAVGGIVSDVVITAGAPSTPGEISHAQHARQSQAPKLFRC